MVVPGSQEVKRQAEAEGLPEIFRAGRLRLARAGLLHVHRDEWRSARAGPVQCFHFATATSKAAKAKADARSWPRPLTAAASALTGVVTDVRTLPQ